MNNRVSNEKYNEIYMLKGIAMFLIIIVHSTQCFPNLNYVIVQISRLGR